MSWDDLSMREKAAMMRVAVKNKIFEIDKIKEAYDSLGKLVSNSEVINPNLYTPSVNLNINPALDYVGNALESISGYEYEGNPLNKLGIDMSFDLGTTGSSMYPNGIKFVKKFDDGGATNTSLNTLTRDLKIDYLKNTYRTKFVDLSDDLFMADHFNNTLGIDENSSDDLINYHYLKALGEVQNGDAIHFDLPEVVVNAYSPLKLHTYYPLSEYMIGHSLLQALDNRKTINTTMKTPGYNLITNNCADDTGKCLERVFGKSMDVIGFTTPGDVKDFALENGGYEKNGIVYIPMNEERLHRFNRYAWEYNKRRGFKNMDVKDYPGAVLPEIKNISTDLY